jgi:outer membrane protein
MKNLSLALNVILLVAVIVLYVLFFNGSKSTSVSQSGSDTSRVSSSIAYINSDTVLKYYDFFIASNSVLESKRDKLTQDYRARATGLQNEFNAYQRNRNSMTIGQVNATEEDLARKEQNLRMYEQSLNQQIMSEQGKVTKDLYDRITAYLKDYSERNGYQLVLKYDLTSDVLYGTPGIDITKDVTAGLNELYKNEKAQGTQKGDTTKTK